MVDSTDRLFVPLNTEPYRSFERGEKEWELRGVNNQFNSETVTEGRTVELRRGYSTDDSLWGVIVEVRVFDSLTAVADELDYTLITPGASRRGFLNSASELVGEYNAFIVFRVENLQTTPPGSENYQA